MKLISKVVGHLLRKPSVNCLLILPVWVSTAFWVALQQNENFQKAIVKELRFKPKFSCPMELSRCSVGIHILKWWPMC